MKCRLLLIYRSLYFGYKKNLNEAEQYAKKLDTKYAELEPVFNPDHFREKYDNVYLDGNFDWSFSYKKVYKWNITEEVPEVSDHK
jgi:hypothetical protein